MDDEVAPDTDEPGGRDDERVSLHRERVTMELYVAITLMAGLLFAQHGWEDWQVFGLVWGTTLGLAAAHWFAYSMANRLVDPTRDRGLVVRELKAQLVGATIVAAWASLAMLLAPDDRQRLAAQLSVVAVVGYIVVGLARSYGQPWGRSIRAAVVAVLVAAAIAAVKEGLIS